MKMSYVYKLGLLDKEWKTEDQAQTVQLTAFLFGVTWNRIVSVQLNYI